MSTGLTYEEIAKVFSKYLGSQVSFDNKEETTGEEYLHSVQVSGCGDTSQNEWDLISSPISLILTPIPSITDEDAIQLSKILLSSSKDSFYTYEYLKVNKVNYDNRDGCDAEESISVYFKGTVNDVIYKNAGWKDLTIMVKIVVRDRYNDTLYFSVLEKSDDDSLYRNSGCAKHIMAFQYLISKHYDVPLWFDVNHWANGKTAIELGIAIEKTK